MRALKRFGLIQGSDNLAPATLLPTSFLLPFPSFLSPPSSYPWPLPLHTCALNLLSLDKAAAILPY